MTGEFTYVSNQEADQSLASLVTGLVVPAAGRGQSEGNAQPVRIEASKSDRAGLSGTERRLLRAIVEHPLQPSSEYASLARISPNTFQKLRPALIHRGLIRERQLESGGRRGRSSLLLDPLDAARELVAAGGNEPVLSEASDDAR